jgi:hypothetical protein
MKEIHRRIGVNTGDDEHETRDVIAFGSASPYPVAPSVIT